MAWTAAVTSRTFSYGLTVVAVQYSDGTVAFTEEYRNARPSLTWLRDTVRDKIKALDDVSTFTPADGPIAPSPDPVVDPAPIAFRAKLRRLEQMMKAVNLGVIQSTLPALVTLQNDIKTDVQNDPTLLQLF